MFPMCTTLTFCWIGYSLSSHSWEKANVQLGSAPNWVLHLVHQSHLCCWMIPWCPSLVIRVTEAQVVTSSLPWARALSASVGLIGFSARGRALPVSAHREMGARVLETLTPFWRQACTWVSSLLTCFCRACWLELKQCVHVGMDFSPGDMLPSWFKYPECSIWNCAFPLCFFFIVKHYYFHRSNFQQRRRFSVDLKTCFKKHPLFKNHRKVLPAVQTSHPSWVMDTRGRWLSCNHCSVGWVNLERRNEVCFSCDHALELPWVNLVGSTYLQMLIKSPSNIEGFFHYLDLEDLRFIHGRYLVIASEILYWRD